MAWLDLFGFENRHSAAKRLNLDSCIHLHQLSGAAQLKALQLKAVQLSTS